MRADLRADGIGHLLAELLANSTHMDGKFPRSMRALVMRPGALTAAFLRGARRQYLTPIQMFVVANVAYFVIQAWLGWSAMSTPLRVHLMQMPYSRFARSHVDAFVAREGLSLEAVTKSFDGRVETFAKSLILLMVPLFALGVAGICRSRAPSFLASSVFSLHFFAFSLWIQGVVWLPVGEALGAGWFGALKWNEVDELMTVGLMASLTLYLVIALRTAFGYSTRAAFLRALALAAVFVAVTMLYRFILFLVVLHTSPAGA